jgi:hypothetical protein
LKILCLFCTFVFFPEKTMSRENYPIMRLPIPPINTLTSIWFGPIRLIKFQKTIEELKHVTDRDDPMNRHSDISIGHVDKCSYTRMMPEERQAQCLQSHASSYSSDASTLCKPSSNQASPFVVVFFRKLNVMIFSYVHCSFYTTSLLTCCSHLDLGLPLGWFPISFMLNIFFFFWYSVFGDS